MGVATFAGFLNGAFAIPNGVLGDVPLTQQFGLDPAFYTHVNGTAPVTLVRPGRYLVGYSVAALLTANPISTSNWMVQFDRGGVDSLVDGLQTWCFHMNIMNGNAGSGGATAFVFQAGDAVRLSVQRFTGNGSLAAEPLSCGLMLEKVE